MTSQALYRKYRPKKFDDVIGQDQVVSVLQGALRLGNVAHAYLFSGPRGTGKTSVARIFAEELKCSPNDLYEIDAASNRGIDDVRALREAVRVLPFDSPRKVYLIDEVHMLTKDAFNALLKTLEEPPAHVIFLLATTEPQKLPETIVSRCETHAFRKPSEDVLRTMIAKCAKEEGYVIEKEALGLLALLADGSFRDALGVLQKVISASAEKKILLAEVQRVTGAPPRAQVEACLRAALDRDLPRALAALAAAAEENADMKAFAKLVMQSARRAMLALYAPDLQQTVFAPLSDDEVKTVKACAAHPNAKMLPALLREFLIAYDQIELAFTPSLPLELALTKLLS